MGRAAIFIDGASLQYILREEFQSQKIDFKKLIGEMTQGQEVLRAYYYDCLPYQSNPPTEDEKERFGKKQRFVNALEHIPRFQVRLGKLEYRGMDSNNKPILEQKRVDILLGVDLALLSAKHQISDAFLMAGDSDFLPAVSVAKQEGVVVHLFYGQRTHHELISECDERTRITADFINKIRHI